MPAFVAKETDTTRAALRSPADDTWRSSVALRLTLLAVVAIMVLVALPGLDRDIALYYDEAVHLVTAKAIASGHGYATESLPGSPPHLKYPPVVSALLAAVWWLLPEFPANLVAMRVLTLLGAVGLVWLSWRYFVEALGMGAIEALGLIAVFAWHRYFVLYSTVLSGEVLYLLLSMTSLYFYARFVASDRVRYLGVAVAVAGLALLTRTAGVALVAALVLHLLLRRRFRSALVAAAFPAAVLAPWQIWGFVAGRAYAGYPPEIASNYVGYLRHFSLTARLEEFPRMVGLNTLEAAGSWAYFVVPSGTAVMPWGVWTGLAVVLLALVLVHRLRRISRQGPSVVDLYCACYLLVVITWPWPFPDRFLLVVSPWLVYYVTEAMAAFVALPGRRWSPRTVAVVSRVILAVLAVSTLTNTLGYVWLGWAVRENTRVVNAEFREMLRWIEQNTPPDAVLIGSSDPVYYLVTGRKAVRLSYPDPFALYYAGGTTHEFPDAGRLLQWFKRVGACYVLQDPMITNRRQILYYRSLIRALAAASAEPLATVYRGHLDAFAVYRIGDCPA